MDHVCGIVWYGVWCDGVWWGSSGWRDSSSLTTGKPVEENAYDFKTRSHGGTGIILRRPTIELGERQVGRHGLFALQQVEKRKPLLPVIIL